MRKKSKRVFTDEQRKAAGDRMREMQKKRWANRQAVVAPPTVSEDVIVSEALAAVDAGSSVAVLERPELDIAPFALVDKSAVDVDVVVHVEGEFKPAPEIPSRIGSKELSIIVRTDGQMVCTNGFCVCGAAKRQWHALCLKQS